MRVKKQLFWQTRDDFRMWVTPAWCGFVGITGIVKKNSEESLKKYYFFNTELKTYFPETWYVANLYEPSGGINENTFSFWKKKINDYAQSKWSKMIQIQSKMNPYYRSLAVFLEYWLPIFYMTQYNITGVNWHYLKLSNRHLDIAHW